ncbi:MAG: hypothetical protein M1834_001440 [Cirrosporium novae-zelandiae]|nr:MAG: hypothetical protein M1834_001440 [Cirrosporium novae-zelandiae]
MAERDMITCHCLDTTAGRPAANMRVSLTLLQPFGPSASFTAVTNTDGRVTRWNRPEGPSIAELFENMKEHEGAAMTWALKFDTGNYFGTDKTFWPEVEVKFFVKPTEAHYHVPLLLRGEDSATQKDVTGDLILLRFPKAKHPHSFNNSADHLDNLNEEESDIFSRHQG